MLAASSVVRLALILALLLLIPAAGVAQFASTVQNTLGCAGQSILNTTYTRISNTADAQVVTGSSGLRIYICHVNLVVASATNLAVVEGTGTTCATGVGAVLGGGSTAATGWNLGANGTLVVGNGHHVIGLTATAANNLCLLRSGTGQVSGSIIWTQF